MICILFFDLERGNVTGFILAQVQNDAPYLHWRFVRAWLARRDEGQLQDGHDTV